MTDAAQAREILRPPVPLSRLRAHPAVAGFAIVFTGTLIIALLQGAKPFYGDSGGYWSLANSFTHDGHFSLLNFESPVRGYAMPLVTYVLRAFTRDVGWSQSSVVKLFNVMLFALIGSVLAPWVAEYTWPELHWSIARRVALTTLLIVFWSGDLNYPLSDFPGLTLLLLSLVAIAQPNRPGRMLIAGFACGLAVDMRPAYLPLLPMLLAIVTLAWVHPRSAVRAPLPRRALCVGLLAVGFAGASLPQALSSHRHYQSWSFIPGRPAHLTQEQLTEGLLLQRYDTFVTPRGFDARMAYHDATGRRLLEEQPGHTITSVGQYLQVAERHPVATAGLMARHLVNGLDMRYSTVYVEHLRSGGHLVLRLAGFLLAFLAVVRVLWPAARRRLGQAHWRYPVALLVCCVTSMVTAIETRFMLPVWLLGSMLVLTPGWPSPINQSMAGLRRFQTLAIIVVAYLAFMAVVWHVVSGATAHVLT